MKIKLTTLLFGLLLAVGWTSNAFAQSAVLAAQDMANWTYKWLPAGATDSVPANYVELNQQTSKYEAPKVTDPYQIYDLLRAVYMDKRLPGPYYSAYTYNYVREDPVYYGGIGGGWGIPGSSNVTTSAVGNITINMTNGNFSFRSIEVRSNGTVIPNCSWSYSANGTNLPNNNWSRTKTFTNESSTSSCYMANGGTITINSSLLQGYTNVEVVINGRHDPNYQDDVTITVSGSTGTSTNRTITQSESSWSDYSFTINGNTSGTNDENFYKPNEEGYTALVVALYNDTTKIHDESNDPFQGAWEFADKDEAIQYITDNIEYVKLLTDGLRIGNESEHTTGTVFNCDGTYNKFFFLGKGQARKKSPRSLQRIANASTWGITGEIYCEEGPFKYMYEEFSPTTGDQGADIFDFYSTMMEGKVYNVVHDCASVIQNKHQFSMSGKKGTQAYGLSGLNFFIPDYRLLFWRTQFNFTPYFSNVGTQYVDGRDMNAYESVTTTGARTELFTNSTSNPFSHWSVYYANYNPDFAPKVGIYRIALEAEAHQCTGYNEDTNPYYEVTLNWTSSLNEMSGHSVDQTYEIYEVTYNPTTGEEELVLITTVQNVTTYTLPCPPNYLQGDYSVTHTYVIKGWPTDSDHPSFIAWSNPDDVVIPGLKDFLKLDIDHYESDFIISQERNYYRNFLMVTNENELKALTTADLMNGMTKYTLYRYDIDKDNQQTPFAEINFTKPSSVDASSVSYTMTYQHQDIEAAKYERSAMGIPDNGTLRVKGSGDVIIWPNGLSVNFKSITVRSGNSTIFRWTSSSANPTTGSWTRSPGCKWVKYEDAYYLEGMGYIAIPAGTTGDVTVTINAYGDGSTTSKITVNDVTRTIANGADNATDYTWTVPAANRAPKRDGNRATETHTSSLVFTQACGGTGTADDGAVWTVTSDASESTFDGNRGIHYGTNQNRVSYLQLTTSGISGTIKSIVVEASRGGNTSANINVTVGGQAFGSQQTLTTSNAEYTFNGSATGDIVVRISKNRTTGGLYCKSIVVTYETEGGDEPPTPGDSKIYEKVTSTDQLVAGKKYILVNETANAFMGAISTYGAAITGPTIANESVTITGDEGILELTLGGEEGAWTLTADGSNYIAYTGSSNTLTTGTDPSATSAQWTATANNGGYRLTNVGTSNRVLQYNSGSPRFACYTSSQADAFLYVEKVETPTPVTDGHMIHLAVPVVDQFYASTATNTHPRGYGYVLKYVPETVTEENPVKESGRVEVPVQHTGSTVNGYYTATDVTNDTDRHMTIDLMSAEVDMTLSATNTKVFYNTIQGKANDLPAEYANYYTVLQRQSDGTFVEMKSPSPLTGKVYQPGEYHYFDSIPTTGTYGSSFKTYVPVVMTMGQDRRYYEEDSLHNTYGAPIWKTGVGQVRDLKTEAQMQRGPQGSTQWQDAQGNACSLYFLGVDAYGDLPSAEVSNIVYEPYMFRVWIQSPSNKLRGCTHVAAGVDPDKPGAHWDGDGTTYGSEPVCVYEGTTTDGHLVLDVQSMAEGNNQPWGEKIQFGAVDNIDDLKIYVRFYYKSTGVAQGAVPATLMLGNRADDSRDYYAAEGSENADDVTTSIHGVYVDFNKTVDSVTYVNTQGMKSDKPFDGVNIVITRYSDGTTSVSKVVK